MYRIADLWLKLKIARIAAAPHCADPRRLENRPVSDCMTPWSSGDPITTNTRRLFGEVTCDYVVLRNLALMMQRMVTAPVSGDIVPDVRALIADQQTPVKLSPDALLATLSEFIDQLLAICQTDISREAIASGVRQEMRLAPAGAEPAPVHIDGNRDRETPVAELGRERIAHQPDRAPIFLEPYSTPLQFSVPAHTGEQWVLAYERRDDDSLIDLPWGVAGSWLGARRVRAGMPGRLLDDNAFVDAPKGQFLIEAVGIDADYFSEVEKAWKIRTRDHPGWPDGYAETMALIGLIHNSRRDGGRFRHYAGSYGVRLDPRREARRPQ